MAMGLIPCDAAYATTAGASAGGSARRRQAVGLSLKIWRAVAPICRARRAAFRKPPATPRWMPTRGASAGQLSRRRGSARATVRAMVDDEVSARAEPPETLEPEPELRPGEGADLVSIALLVFFVALLLTAVGLLALPLILG